MLSKSTIDDLRRASPQPLGWGVDLIKDPLRNKGTHRGLQIAYSSRYDEGRAAFGVHGIFGTNKALSEYNLGLRQGGDLALGGERLPDNILYTPQRHYAYVHKEFLDSIAANAGQLDFNDPSVQEILATLSKGKPVASEALLANPTYGSGIIQFDTPGIEDIKLRTAGIDPNTANIPSPGFALFGRSSESNRWEGISRTFTAKAQEAFPEFLNSQILAEHLSEWQQAETEITSLGTVREDSLFDLAKHNQEVYSRKVAKGLTKNAGKTGDLDILFRPDRAYRHTNEGSAADLLEDIKGVKAGKINPSKVTIVGVEPLAAAMIPVGLNKKGVVEKISGGLAPDPYFHVGETLEAFAGPENSSLMPTAKKLNVSEMQGNVIIESVYDEKTWLDMRQSEVPDRSSTVPPRAPTLADPVRVWKHNPSTQKWDILYDNIGDQARLSPEIFEADPQGWEKFEEKIKEVISSDNDFDATRYIPEETDDSLHSPLHWSDSYLDEDKELLAFKGEVEDLTYQRDLRKPLLPREAIQEAEAARDFDAVRKLKATYGDQRRIYNEELKSVRGSSVRAEEATSVFTRLFRESEEYHQFRGSLPRTHDKQKATVLRETAAGKEAPRITSTPEDVKKSYFAAMKNFVKRKGGKRLGEEIKEKLSSKGILGVLLALGVGVGLPSVASASTLGAAAGSSSGNAGLAVLGGIAAVGVLALGYSRINPATRSRITSSVGSTLGKVPNIMSVASSRGGFIERELELTTKGLAGSMSSIINEWGFNRRESATGGTIDTKWGRAWTTKGLGRYVAPAEEGWMRVSGKRELYTQWDDYITNSKAFGSGARRFAYGLLGGKNSSANRWLARMGGFGTVLPTGIALYFAGKDAVEGYHENGIIGGVTGAAQGYLKAAVANRIIGSALLNPGVGITGLAALAAVGYGSKRMFEVMTEGNLYLQNNRQRTSWTTNASMSIASSTVATMRQRAIAAIENSKYSSMKSLGNEAYMITSPRSRYASNTIMGNSSPMMSY